MSDFTNANVDKDLFNQIFSGEGEAFNSEETDTQINLDGVEFDIPETEASTEEVLAQGASGDESLNAETPAEADVTPESVENTPVTENESPILEVPEEETGAEEEYTGEDAIDSEAEDDIVNEEARRVMDTERENGTVTLITENTTINGSISSDGSLEVMGVITGDIECLGKVYINGKVSGGVVASEIYVNTPRLLGGLQSEGTVKIGVGTMILGDVSGTSAYIAGAVKGNIDIDGPVIVESTAVVKGDIKAKSITISSGAVVDGYCSLNYAGVDLDKFFEEE